MSVVRLLANELPFSLLLDRDRNILTSPFPPKFYAPAASPPSLDSVLSPHLCPPGSSLIAHSVTCFCPFPLFLSLHSSSPHFPSTSVFSSSPSSNSWTDWGRKSGKETCLDSRGHQYLQPNRACTCWSVAALPRGSSTRCQSEFIALHRLSIKTV